MFEDPAGFFVGDCELIKGHYCSSTLPLFQLHFKTCSDQTQTNLYALSRLGLDFEFLGCRSAMISVQAQFVKEKNQMVGCVVL